jgi:hypothetical protein
MERFIKIAIVAVIVIIAGYFLYSLFSSWHKESLETAKRQERVEWEKRTKELMEKMSGLEEELESVKGQTVPEEKLKEVFGQEPSQSPASQEQRTLTLEELEQQIKAFFAYLDQQDYVQTYQLKDGTYQQFRLVLKKLTENQPTVTEETASLYNLYRNMAYFFRVLGKKRVNLTKDILQNEAEILESVMNTFYLWLTFENGSGTSKDRPTLKILYDYSGFFLNTLAGKSYLLRRNSKTRILTTYYSVLILDRANDENLNSNGIDIRPHIEIAYNDINNQIGLIHQKQYLLELEKLAKKYKMF